MVIPPVESKKLLIESSGSPPDRRLTLFHSVSGYRDFIFSLKRTSSGEENAPFISLYTTPLMVSSPPGCPIHNASPPDRNLVRVINPGINTASDTHASDSENLVIAAGYGINGLIRVGHGIQKVFRDPSPVPQRDPLPEIPGSHSTECSRIWATPVEFSGGVRKPM